MYTYTLILGSAFILRSDGAYIPQDPENIDYVAYLSWVAEGNTAAAPTAPPMSTQVVAYETAIQAALDSYAQSWGYTDLVTAASYAASTIPKYAAEAKALIAWRDSVWVWAEAYLAQVEAGTLSIPTTPAALLAAMPPEPQRPTTS